MKTAAEPRTPNMATATAERRCAEVGVGKESSMAVEFEVSFVDSVEGRDEAKKDVGRAIRTTPSREIKEAYWAEREKGSLRNR